MLSRVAENLYWMSRYLERAEHTARLLDVELQLRLERLPHTGASRWKALLEALQIPMDVPEVPDSGALTASLIFDRDNRSSIAYCVGAARENLRHVREQCSTEMWEHLNRLYLRTMDTVPESDRSRLSQFLREVQEKACLFHGVADSTMRHGEGWQYILLGRYVEQTDLLAELLRVHFARLEYPLDQTVENADYLEWVGLLKWCLGFEPYCQLYTAEIRPLRVAEFLMLNAEFPHSVRYSVDQVHAALQAVGEITERRDERPHRIFGRLRAQLSFSGIDELMGPGAPAFLRDIRRQCSEASAAIHQIYFDYPVEAAHG